jgi:hypothetical protein
MRQRRAWVGWGMVCLLAGLGFGTALSASAAEIGTGRPKGPPSKLQAWPIVNNRARQSTLPAVLGPGPVWFGVQDQLVWPYPLLIPRAPGKLMTGTRLVVAEAGRVRLFDLNGNAVSRAIPTHGAISVAVLATRILVSDEGRVRVYDWNGNQQGTEILTTGSVEVRFAPARFVVADAGRLRFFDYNANSLGTEIPTDP